jgi:membrane protein
MVVLIWLYYSALIFLFGAEFTQVYARRQGKQIQPSDYAYSYDKRDVQPDPPPEPAEVEGVPAR